MAGGMDLGGARKGGKKPLDTAINLVPFIDLMAVTISFLIMTAVWNQLHRLQVTQSGGAPSDPAPQPTRTLPVTLVLSARGASLLAGSATVEIANVEGRIVLCHAAGADDPGDGTRCEEKSLVGELKKLKDQVPEQRSITLECEDAVRYEDLVRVLDACNLEDAAHAPLLFPDVQLGGVG